VTPEERFAAICEAFLADERVSQPDSGGAKKTFGSGALRLNKRIFAMLARGNLVVKLPAHRVEALIASGAGQRYDPGTGRRMKEWLSVPPTATDAAWLSLAREAHAHAFAQK